jgi:HK97 family phage prohead protease
VIKDSDGEIEGCHDSQQAVRKQMAALYASERPRFVVGPPGPELFIPEPIGDAMSADGDVFRFLAPATDLFELREEGGGHTLVGHFSVFDQWARISSHFEGDFMERVSPGAFKKTFAENRANMRVLFQHGKDVLGEQILGPIRELREEERGAYYEVPLYEGIPQLIVNGLRDGAYGASFRMRVMKENFPLDRAEPAEHNPDGLRERTIQEARVFEFGPVTFPAYEGATAGLRSATDWWREQSLRSQLEAFVGERAAALESEPEPEPESEPEPEPEPSSRRTRVDHLNVREEAKPWRL